MHFQTLATTDRESCTGLLQKIAHITPDTANQLKYQIPQIQTDWKWISAKHIAIQTNVTVNRGFKTSQMWHQMLQNVRYKKPPHAKRQLPYNANENVPLNLYTACCSKIVL